MAITKKVAYKAVAENKVTQDIINYFAVELEKMQEADAARKTKSAEATAEVDAIVADALTTEPRTAKEVAKALAKKLGEDAPNKNKVVSSLTRLF